jgi:Ner family transcriptional regulator
MTKKPATPDWHKSDIKAALEKRGLHLKGLAISNGYRSVDAVNQALFRPYPKAERIIAKALGVKPEIIWPSRYVGKFNRSSVARKVNSQGVA